MKTPFDMDDDLSHLQGITHGFFGRKGGVSEGLYASLNAGPGSADSPEHVIENRKRVMQALGLEPVNLCTLYQIHSDNVLTVEKPWNADNRPQADAMVTKTPGVALGILTADCAPILMVDEQAGVVGAAHAGWKGAFANIMARTVEAMEALGGNKANITVAIGPCIGQASYEVDELFYRRFLEQSSGNARFFIPSQRRKLHHHFDLAGYVQGALLTCGVKSANILAKDTCFYENAYFSFRRKTLRGEADYGRQISVIALVP